MEERRKQEKLSKVNAEITTNTTCNHWIREREKQVEQESTSDGWIFTFAIVYTIIDTKINTNTSPENLLYQLSHLKN